MHLSGCVLKHDVCEDSRVHRDRIVRAEADSHIKRAIEVKLYRRAVAAVPGEQDWKQTLREAERELLAAPN